MHNINGDVVLANISQYVLGISYKIFLIKIEECIVTYLFEYLL